MWQTNYTTTTCVTTTWNDLLTFKNVLVRTRKKNTPSTQHNSIVGALHVNTVLHACPYQYLPPLPYIKLKHPAVIEDHSITCSPHHHQCWVGCMVTFRVMKADSRVEGSRHRPTRTTTCYRPTRTTTCYSCPHLQIKNVFHFSGASGEGFNSSILSNIIFIDCCSHNT